MQHSRRVKGRRVAVLNGSSQRGNWQEHVIIPSRQAVPVSSALSDEQAAELGPPQGAPVYHVDALADTGQSLHDILGRLFGRPHWLPTDQD